MKNKIPEGEHQTKILSKYFYSIKTLLILMMMVVVIMMMIVMITMVVMMLMVVLVQIVSSNTKPIGYHTDCWS